MALHRNIYWVGRQWAVTGHGIQACDQKQKGQFDIEASRIWEDGVLEGIRALKWLNNEDFDKALSVARKHYPEPPRKAALFPEKGMPPERSVLGLIGPVLKEPNLKEAIAKEGPMEEPKPAAQIFAMRVVGWPAKFVPQWRVRIGR
jgi:hypothetical protein